MERGIYQQPLELFAPQPWTGHLAAEPRLRVVSGGRAGVDRAALDAAVARGLEAVRSTRRTVQDSDATLVLTLGARDGALQAAQAAARIGRPFIVIPLEAADAMERVRAWLAEVRPRVLNIAGPRESLHPGIYGRAFAFLSRVLRPYAP
jgi:hypothetical protein